MKGALAEAIYFPAQRRKVFSGADITAQALCARPRLLWRKKQDEGRTLPEQMGWGGGCD